MTAVFYAIAVLFVCLSTSLLWNLCWVRRLPKLCCLAGPSGPGSDATGRIRCSIVIAACDEESRIELTIRKLLAQTGVEVELIVVNDRSTDKTGEILARLAAEDRRLRVLHVKVLPDGWLGKCHACHVGANAAGGDWILFTDADCWLKPDVLERAIKFGELERADHVTLAPGVEVDGFGAMSFHLLFLTSLMGWFSAVNRDRPGARVGIGAFNLVRAGAYRDCGGYEALRLTVLDDIKMGLLLSRAGKRTRSCLGADDVECHWGRSVADLVKVFEKNYFAALDYRLAPVLSGSLVAVSVLVILILGVFAQNVEGIAAFLSPLSMVIPSFVLARRLGWSGTAALGVPFVIPVMLFAMINSTYVTLSQGGIWWRETFYPIDQLRKGNVR